MSRKTQRPEEKGEREVDRLMAEQSEHTRHLRLGCILLRLECVPSEIQVANEMVIGKAFKGHLRLEGSSLHYEAEPLKNFYYS